MNTSRDLSRNCKKRRPARHGLFSPLCTSACRPSRWSWRSIARSRWQLLRKKPANANKPNWRKIVMMRTMTAKRRRTAHTPRSQREAAVTTRKESERRERRSRASLNRTSLAKTKTWPWTATWETWTRLRRRGRRSMRHHLRHRAAAEAARSQWIPSRRVPSRINQKVWALTTTWSQPSILKMSMPHSSDQFNFVKCVYFAY